MNFIYSETLLATALVVSRKALRALRREKKAALRWEERDGTVFYEADGVAQIAAALGLSLPADGFRVLLEKTRGEASGAQDGPSEKPAAAPAPVPVMAQVIRQYPNLHYWRAHIDGQVVDIYEPKRPWKLGVRKRVQIVPVPGRRYWRLA